MLNVPKNSTVSIYNWVAAVWRVLWLRKEHYDISMQMGRTLFPIRSTPTTTIAAAGTSCRHQILMERIETPNIRSLF
jgi:hypothetical protein